MNVEAEDVGQIDQFHEIDAPITTLDIGYERLVTPHFASDRRLRQTGRFATFHQYLDQTPMSF